MIINILILFLNVAIVILLLFFIIVAKVNLNYNLRYANNVLRVYCKFSAFYNIVS